MKKVYVLWAVYDEVRDLGHIYKIFTDKKKAQKEHELFANPYIKVKLQQPYFSRDTGQNTIQEYQVVKLREMKVEQKARKLKCKK